MPYRYIKSEAAAAAIRRLPTLAPRTYGACHALLMQLGQSCVDRREPHGQFAEAEAKMAMPTGWRTVKKYLAVLEQSGAIIAVKGGWRVAGFNARSSQRRVP